MKEKNKIVHFRSSVKDVFLSLTLRSSGTRFVGAILKVCYFFSFGGYVNRPQQARPLGKAQLGSHLVLLYCCGAGVVMARPLRIEFPG